MCIYLYYLYMYICLREMDEFDIDNLDGGKGGERHEAAAARCKVKKYQKAGTPPQRCGQKMKINHHYPLVN